MQAVYQLAVMSAILWDGGRTLGLSPAEQATFVFNTFVVMQLFNQVACRKAFDEPNFLEGLGAHRFFLGVVAAEASLQARPRPASPALFLPARQHHSATCSTLQTCMHRSCSTHVGSSTPARPPAVCHARVLAGPVRDSYVLPISYIHTAPKTCAPRHTTGPRCIMPHSPSNNRITPPFSIVPTKGCTSNHHRTCRVRDTHPGTRMQALIVQFGGPAFGTVPLPPRLWAVSTGFALAGWGLRQVLILIPTRKFDEAVEQPAQLP